MGPQACREYLQTMRVRYAAAERGERARLLDEMVAVTGFHRKAVIRALWRQPRSPGMPVHRQTPYGAEVVAALAEIWRAADYPWSVRLKAMLPHWIPWLRERRVLSAAVETALATISTRTIDRLLQSRRGDLRRRHYGRTRTGSLLKHQVAIRSERWNVSEAGWGEIDTVHHCGEVLAGEYAVSLNFTDIASTWTEGAALRTKAQRRVVEAMESIAQSLPFQLLGLDSDSGTEFLNAQFMAFCYERKLTFTRSRPYRKNDNAHIEQKNFTHVRKLFGWRRVHEQRVVDMMNDLYRNELRVWMNLFQPSVKLVEKKRVGSRIVRIYDRAQTPLERLIALGTLSAQHRRALETLRDRTDPFALSAIIERKLAAFNAAASAQQVQATPPPRRPPIFIPPRKPEHEHYRPFR